MKIFNFGAKYRDIRAGYHGGEAKYRDIRGGYHGGEAKYRDMRTHPQPLPVWRGVVTTDRWMTPVNV
jgi:hypothetical protein